ncbi:hypothetical protein ACQEVM_37955 [Streptomyces sp. CA-243310]|uniref:hypothetical protein n=1 Tax=Streptomyces sp. CA-243310 TaxID=3240056 RepID=UPI003D8B001C
MMMSHGSSLTQKARYRSHCTGVSHQTGMQELQAADGQHPVPEAGRDQARLEAAVFERLGGTIDYCAHPTGVAQLTPRPTHLTLAVDRKLGPRHRLYEHCLQALLPTQYTGTDEGGDGLGGIVGVRLLTIDEAGLHLGLAGTDARVTLTGPTEQQWCAAVASHQDSLRQGPYDVLWDAPDLTRPELDYVAKDPTWWGERDEAAWVASSLLRRIGLFHMVTKPFCVRYWQHGLGWKFELNYEHGVPVDHDAVIEHLTHPRWGMNAKVTRDHCACKPCDCDGGAERSCWFTLEPEGPGGEVVIHFRKKRSGYDVKDVYGRLVQAGASSDWLVQALPVHHAMLANA